MLSPSAITTFISCGFSSYTVFAGCVSGGRAGQSKCTPWLATSAANAAQSRDKNKADDIFRLQRYGC